MISKFTNGEKMSKITELCQTFNRMWDDIPEPKRFMYFVAAALVWSILIATVPIIAFLIAGIAIFIRFQHYIL
jgi:hypothetical protein